MTAVLCSNMWSFGVAHLLESQFLDRQGLEDRGYVSSVHVFACT